jgi:hypothetical protein
MKKAMILAALSLLAMLILIPVESIVNQTLGNPVLDKGTFRADGAPMPPLPPKKLHRDSTSLVADGAPMPPLPPKKLHRDFTSLVADGAPMPPLPPKKLRSSYAAAYMIA